MKKGSTLFHAHTNYSYDSNISPKKLIDILLRLGVKKVIITDHETIRGALLAARYSRGRDIEVVVGEEICTDIGDIIGFPLTKEITSRKHQKVISEIKSQGGFVALPHPYRNHCFSKIHDSDFLKYIDFVETFNLRTSEKDDAFAVLLAKKRGIGVICGADVHLKQEIGLWLRGEKTTLRNVLRSQLIKFSRVSSLLRFVVTLVRYVVNV